VNRRLVRDRLILHAIHEAYRNILPPPFFRKRAFWRCPTTNRRHVHPQKIEVRFRRSQFVHDFVRECDSPALMGVRLSRVFATATAGRCFAAVGTGNGTLSGGIRPALESGVRARSFRRWKSRRGHRRRLGLRSKEGDSISPRAIVRSNSGFLHFGNCIWRSRRSAQLSPDGKLGCQSCRAERGRSRKPSTPEQSRTSNAWASKRELHHAVNAEGLWILDQQCPRTRAFRQASGKRAAPEKSKRNACHALVIGFSPRQFVTFEKIAKNSRQRFRSRADGPKAGQPGVPTGVIAPDAEKLLREILDGIERENAPSQLKRCRKNRGVHCVPCGNQVNCRSNIPRWNGCWTRCENRLPDELPTDARCPSLFPERNRKAFTRI